MTSRRPTKRELDDAFPTIVRYLGVAVVIVFVVASVAGLNPPESVIIAATGLILYKTVRGESEKE